MRRICACCKKDLGEVDSEGGGSAVITHGLCGDCAFHLSARMGMRLREFLQGLGKPVVAVSPDGTIQSTNGQASALLGMDLPEIEGHLCGDVFECDHAALPEGCGRTVHCVACTVRKCITETFETGRSCERVPGHLNHTTFDGPDEICFLISTEKLGDLILLRLDSVDGYAH